MGGDSDRRRTHSSHKLLCVQHSDLCTLTSDLASAAPIGQHVIRTSVPLHRAPFTGIRETTTPKRNIPARDMNELSSIRIVSQATKLANSLIAHRLSLHRFFSAATPRTAGGALAP